jgi:hypothetical protein
VALHTRLRVGITKRGSRRCATSANSKLSVCRGKHLRALLRAFKQGSGYSTDGSILARQSDLIFQSCATSRIHSVTSVDSYGSSLHPGASKATEENTMEPTAPSGTSAPRLSVAGFCLDRSQLSFVRAGKEAQQQSPRHNKHLSWSDLPVVERSALEQLPADVPLSLSLHAPLATELYDSFVHENPSFELEKATPQSAPESDSDSSSREQSRGADDDDGEDGSVIINEGPSLDLFGSGTTDVARASLEAASTGEPLVQHTSSTSDGTSRAIAAPPSSCVGADTRDAAGNGPGPVAEGEEPNALPAAAAPPESKKMGNSVSFQVQNHKGLHRHKSSNYSQVLDARVDDWCAPASCTGIAYCALQHIS